MRLIEIIESLITAMICGIFAVHVTRRRDSRAVRLLRWALLVFGISSVAGVVYRLVTGSNLRFELLALEAVTWMGLTVFGMLSYLRTRRRPSFAVRITTNFVAVTSSFGLVWLLAISKVVRQDSAPVIDRVVSATVLVATVAQLATFIVAIKRTGPKILPGLMTFMGGALTVSTGYALAAFEHVGLLQSSKGFTDTLFLLGASLVGKSLWTTNYSVKKRSSSPIITALFYAPAALAVVASVGRFAETLDQLVYGFTIVIMVITLIGQHVSHQSVTRRTQEILERRVRQRTHQLEEAHLLTKQVIEHVADGIVALDKDDKLLLANPAARRMIDIESMGVDDHVACHLGSDGGCELTTERDGQMRTIKVSISPLSAETGGRVMTLRDVTDERSVLDMKSRVLTTVSHEIRTPLTSLHGSLTLLNSESIGALPKEIGTLVKIAQTSSDRLMRLVNEYLDFERLSATTHRGPRLEVVDLDTVIGEVARLMTPIAARRMVGLEFKPTRISLSAERDRIIQVLTNLVHNAIKFSGSECIVRVEATTVEDSAVISVLDCGPGVNDAYVDQLFEPFFQADTSAPGSGMGLAICRSIVASHQGRIWAENRATGGAAFHFTIPLSVGLIEKPLAS